MCPGSDESITATSKHYHGHSRSLLQTPTVGALTTGQKQQLLDMHNGIRDNVAGGTYAGNGGVALPSAANMNELIWV